MGAAKNHNRFTGTVQLEKEPHEDSVFAICSCKTGRKWSGLCMRIFFYSAHRNYNVMHKSNFV